LKEEGEVKELLLLEEKGEFLLLNEVEKKEGITS
jgi:hypothetical protein